VLVHRFTAFVPPRPGYWLFGLAVAGVVGAIAYTLVRRPDAHAAAVAIDQKLGLKEKFSTALAVRGSRDEFAQAAVQDAERTADNVSLHRQFPLGIPTYSMHAMGLALAAFLLFAFLPEFDVFGRKQAEARRMEELRQQQEAREVVERALATVNAVPQSLQNDEQIKLARQELEKLLAQPMKDPGAARRSAARALQDMQEAMKADVARNQKIQQAKNDLKLVRQLQPPGEAGPIADVHRAISEGKLDEAVAALEKAVEQFEQMSEEEKKQAAEQMEALAKQLQELAKDQQRQQQMEQQLQQLGMDQQQAQQLVQQMQKAAAGDQQAQQQVAQATQQLVQQLANQGASQQQQQAVQQMLQQMQAQANAQQQAGQMGQAAQQLAQAMQQAAQQGQQGQQAQQGQGMQPSAQALAKAIQQLQQNAQDAQQIAAAQQAAIRAAEQAAKECAGGGQDPDNQGGDGQPADQGGQGGWAQAGGDRPKPQESPYGVKDEVSASEDNEEGRILATTLIKDREGLKGESKEQLKEVLEMAEAEATDEVDQERVSRQAQKAVKDYFGSMQEDAR
jgi:hypothetical protein